MTKKSPFKPQHQTKENMKTLTIAYSVLVLLSLIACESPTNVKDNPSEQGVALVVHPFACIESYPVVPDTIIKKLEAYTLKVGNGPRNRCRYSEEDEAVFCKAKSPDTLYVIDTYCPATRQALNEMGG